MKVKNKQWYEEIITLSLSLNFLLGLNVFYYLIDLTLHFFLYILFSSL